MKPRTRKDKGRADRRTAGDRGDSGTLAYEYALGSLLRTEHRAKQRAALAGEAARVEPLPTRQGDVPILAWKAAHVQWLPGQGYSFRGIGHSVTYGVDATASCDAHFDLYKQALRMSAWTNDVPKPTPHDAPKVGCRCGFYAMRALPDVADGAHFLLTVELFGRVIVCENGYRAQRQRVMQVAVPKECVFCPEHPDFAVIPNGYTTSERADLSPRCAQHVGPFDTPIEWGALSKVLGCPVEFASAPVSENTRDGEA